MKFLPLFILFLATLCVARAETPPSTGDDPVVGRWRWSGNNIVVLSPDGKALQYKPEHQMRGRWEFTPSTGPATDAERRYVVNWEGGLYIDYLYLSSDKQHLHGANQKKWKVHAMRAEEGTTWRK